MYFKISILCFFSYLALCCNGQNLVPNGDFNTNHFGEDISKFNGTADTHDWVLGLTGVFAWKEYSKSGNIARGKDDSLHSFSAGKISGYIQSTYFEYLVNKLYNKVNPKYLYNLNGSVYGCNELIKSSAIILLTDTFLNLGNIGSDNLSSVLKKIELDTFYLDIIQGWHRFKFSFKPKKAWHYIYLFSLESNSRKVFGRNIKLKLKKLYEPYILFDNLYLGTKENNEKVVTSITIAANILFPNNEDSIEDVQANKIDSFVKIQLKDGREKIYLTGYADTNGNKTYNLNLSKRRVEHVKKYINSKYKDEFEIITQFKGEDESTLPIHQQRRVEIFTQFAKNPWLE
jgi:outer membrane protein OmpA-like peptidoglycan-associated protein